MPDVIQVPRSRARWAIRALALLSAAWMVIAGAFALRHETTVAHVRGALTGELQHAHELADHHTHSTTPHLHGRPADGHDEASGCVLLAALGHALISTSAAEGAVPRHAAPAPAAASSGIALVARALLRLAPKTSPPAIA